MHLFAWAKDRIRRGLENLQHQLLKKMRLPSTMRCIDDMVTGGYPQSCSRRTGRELTRMQRVSILGKVGET